MAKTRINWRQEYEWAFANMDEESTEYAPPSKGSKAFLKWAREHPNTFFKMAQPFLNKMATAEEVEALTDEGVEVLEMIEVCRRQMKEEAAMEALTNPDE